MLSLTKYGGLKLSYFLNRTLAINLVEFMSGLESIQDKKEKQKKIQIQSIYTKDIPRAIEEALSSIGEAKEFLKGILANKWTATDVVMVVGRNIAQSFNSSISEYNFEKAIDRANLLDQYFHQTGELIGPLHGLPVVLSDESSIKGLGKIFLCRLDIGMLLQGI
jgi:hypothetical protein